MITTTKEFVDQIYEEDYLRERAYIQAETEYKEKQLMQELLKPAEIVLGEGRKVTKFDSYARVTTRKRPRILKLVQRNH